MAGDLKVSVDTIRERMFLERMRLLHPDKVEAVQSMKKKDKERFIEENWSKLFPPVDPALRKVVTGPLQKAVNKGMDAVADEMMRTHWEPQIKAKLHNTYEFYIIMLRYSTRLQDRSAEEQSRLLLNYYLLMVEGVYSAQVNLISYLLVNSGLTYRSSKAASEHGAPTGSMGMIEEDSLWNKLRFLEDNGYPFLVDACDRQLRNSVAHLDFIVFTNGSVGYGNGSRGPKVISYEELVHKVEVLKSITDAVNEVLAEQLNDWRKAIKQKKEQKATAKPATKTVKKSSQPKDPREILKAAEMKDKGPPKPKEPMSRL